MKSHLIHLFCFLIIFSSFILGVDSTKTLNGFRGFQWGVSSEEVESRETLPLLQSFSGFGTYTLSFEGEFAGLNTNVDFTFRENKLTEGMYVFDNIDNLTQVFTQIQNHLTELYDKPDQWANHFITDTEIWVQVTEYGKYKGPELYWEFKDGFIGLIASRFKDEISIKVLYAGNTTIEEYGDNSVNLYQFNPNFD